MTTDEQKESRIYYHGIVYAICNIMDVYHGRKPGRGILCGSFTEPNANLQNEVGRLAAKCKRLEIILARAVHGECTWHHGSFMVEAEKALDNN